MIVNVASPTFDPADSYGRLAYELSNGLQALGWRVNEIGAEHRTDMMHRAAGGFLLGYPTNFRQFGPLINAGARVAITMFESTRLPNGWVQALNQMSAIIVPARFLVDLWRAEGVRSPIHVVPLGISEEFRRPVLRQRGERLRVLAVADRGNRKNALGAVSAFLRAFGDDMRYELILKGREDSFRGVSRLMNPNITLIRQSMSNQELADLYQSCDAMLFPTRGEGFGLPPREFAATGGIALATGWGGTADDVLHWGWPIDFKMETAWQGHDVHRNLGQWANPSIDAMATTLRMIDTHYNTYALSAYSKARFALTAYQWGEFAARCAEIYQEVSHARNG